MGGLASNIADIARHLKDKNIPEKPMNDITHMGDIVDGMVSKSLSAFLNEDMNLVRELKKDDDKVDDSFDLHLRIYPQVCSKRRIQYRFLYICYLLQGSSRELLTEQKISVTEPFT